MAQLRFLTVLAMLSACAGLAGTLSPAVAQTQGDQTSPIVTNTIGMKLAPIPFGEAKNAKSLYLGVYEVTLGQFLTFYHDAKYTTDIEQAYRKQAGLARSGVDRRYKASWGYNSSGELVESNDWRPWSPGWPVGMDHPAVYVSFNDATEFCKWLSKKEGKTYRLPTEAEWAFAFRAGAGYVFGDRPLAPAYGNAFALNGLGAPLGGTVAAASFGNPGLSGPLNAPTYAPSLTRHVKVAWTLPVGRFGPNRFGLYDMSGNAWEWRSDWIYERGSADAPKGLPDYASRFTRAGGLGLPPTPLSVPWRDPGDRMYRAFNLGFRVAAENLE